jgi:hypothetical protein
MMRFAGLLTVVLLVALSSGANDQTDANSQAGHKQSSQKPPATQVQPVATDTTDNPAENSVPAAPGGQLAPAKPNIPPTAEDICRAVQQDAAENELPV